MLYYYAVAQMNTLSCSVSTENPRSYYCLLQLIFNYNRKYIRRTKCTRNQVILTAPLVQSTQYLDVRQARLHYASRSAYQDVCCQSDQAIIIAGRYPSYSLPQNDSTWRLRSAIDFMLHPSTEPEICRLLARARAIRYQGTLVLQTTIRYTSI